MRSLFLLSLVACIPNARDSLPPVGATRTCEGNRQRVVSHGLAMCIYHREGGVAYVDHGGEGYVHDVREAFLRDGPVEGVDPWGLHVRGWYLDDHREGAWQFTDDRGVVRAEGHFLDGHRDGTWTVRYDNGQVASVVTYQYGSRKGPAWFWYRDGKPWWQGKYGWYKPVGTWVHWDREGQRSEVDARESRTALGEGTFYAVGPLAERVDFAGDDDHECPYDFATLRWALEARKDGFAYGTIDEGGDAGAVVDENGEVVLRGDDSDPECHDEAGRRIADRQWWDNLWPETYNPDARVIRSGS